MFVKKLSRTKNKICILTSAHGPFDTRIFHKEARSLAKAGYDVSLITQHDKEEVVDGVRIVPLPRPKNRIQRMGETVWITCQKALKVNANVYHFHDPELIPVGVILKLLGKKVIYDVHEDYKKQTLSKTYIPAPVRRIIASGIRLTENISARFFDAVITATPDILSNFSWHRNAVTVKNFPMLDTFTVIRKENCQNDTFRIIYTGGLTKIRGITEIVQALEYIKPDKSVQLILCGKFDSAEYNKKIMNLAGFSKATYLGMIDFRKIPEQLTAADAGIVCLWPRPNYLVALPVKLFEYMAAGLPVIASDFPLWQEIVKGNKCGICVNPLNPKEIAEAIEYLIEHLEEAKKMGENGKKAVLEKYNWENESQKLLEVYGKLCRKK